MQSQATVPRGTPPDPGQPAASSSFPTQCPACAGSCLGPALARSCNGIIQPAERETPTSPGCEEVRGCSDCDAVPGEPGCPWCADPCDVCEGTGRRICVDCGEFSATEWHPVYLDRPATEGNGCCAACLPLALEHAAALRGAA